jgi:hypothetical protein
LLAAALLAAAASLLTATTLATTTALLAAAASLLTATTLAATTALLAATTTLPFTFLIAFLLLASLLAGTPRFTGFIRITLCFHITFRFINFLVVSSQFAINLQFFCKIARERLVGLDNIQEARPAANRLLAQIPSRK